MARWPLPDDYHHPHAVAARLQRILDRRPRLAFDPDQIPLVTEALTTEQTAVTDSAAELMDDLTRTLADTKTTSPPLGQPSANP